MTPLFDPTTLKQKRDRARSAFVDFIQTAAADEVEERLNEVNRTFTDATIITPWPDVWQGRLDATIIEEADVLPLEPESQDLIVHAMSLHWSNDPVGQLIQCKRALKPDGMFVATLFGGQTLHELRSALAEAEVKHSGGLTPRIAPMGEVRDLGGLLQRAGFALPVADVTPLTVSYANAFHLMQELRGMGETNVLNGRTKCFTPRGLLTDAAATYAEAFGDTDGRIPATFEIVTLTGWAPDASQPQPLRPGSAAQRLADALGTDEGKLPES